MTAPAPTDPRFSSLREILSHQEGGPAFSHPASDEGTRAAVSLILKRGRELEILLIRRAELDGDPWSGHMALPGGRWEPEDEDLQATAMRESWEETGVQLGKEGIALGKLNPLTPATKRLPSITIFPFVFGVEEGTQASVASPEVDEVLWAPLSHFAEPDASGSVEIRFGEDVRVFPCFRVGERVIWGLTYRILSNFIQRIEQYSP